LSAACSQTQAHTLARARAHTHKHAHTHTHAQREIKHTHTHIRRHMHTHIHTQALANVNEEQSQDSIFLQVLRAHVQCKRDLLYSQRTHSSKRTHSCVCVVQKRPTIQVKETYYTGKRDLQLSAYRLLAGPAFVCACALVKRRYDRFTYQFLKLTYQFFKLAYQFLKLCNTFIYNIYGIIKLSTHLVTYTFSINFRNRRSCLQA
jgi:hypothetical protein